MKFVFFKKVLVRMFFMKKSFRIFLRKMYLLFNFFFTLLSFFYKHSVSFWVRLSILMIFLSWTLYYAYIVCSSSCGHSKEYVNSDGEERGTPKASEGGSSKILNKPMFFIRVFAHLNCWFLFFTSLMGKWNVVRQVAWKVALYIAAYLTPPRYLDINF